MASRAAAFRERAGGDQAVASIAGLRVLHVIPQADGRKSDFTFAKRQVNSLEQEGVLGRVFYFYPAKPLLPQWRQLSEEVKAFHPDLLHAHYGTVTGCVCAFGMQVPLAMTFRGSDLNPDPSVGKLRFAASRVLSQVAAARARGIVCVTNELRSRLWWGQARTVVSSGGIDLERYRPIPRDQARRQLEWPAERKVVLFNAGTNARIKRIDMARAAVEHAKSIVPELELVVLNGEVDPDQVPLMLNAADCLLVTSDFEGSPYIVKEALACDLPIVSVAAGDIAERLAGVSPSRIVERDAARLGDAVAEIVLSGRRSNGRETVLDISEAAETERLGQAYLRALD